jgi:hypothetical protein
MVSAPSETARAVPVPTATLASAPQRRLSGTTRRSST